MAKTHKGHIQRLPSGSFRVKVYAGTDPVTGKQRLLSPPALQLPADGHDSESAAAAPPALRVPLPGTSTALPQVPLT